MKHLAALLLAGPAAGQINIIVTTLADENDTPSGAEVSLREALRDAPNSGNILFEAPLPGGTLVLKSGELAVTGKTVSVAAPGLVIEARNLSRIFRVDAGAGLSLAPPVGSVPPGEQTPRQLLCLARPLATEMVMPWLSSRRAELLEIPAARVEQPPHPSSLPVI